jgi:hypothetical protein
MKFEEMPPKLAYAIAALFSLLIAGTVFYHYFENWSWVDSAFFATQTITTVGYGNVIPSTDAGKIFTIAYMLTGIGIALYALSQLGGYYMEQRFEERALHAASRPHEHLKKIKCMITPGSDDCRPAKKNKDLFGNAK